MLCQKNWPTFGMKFWGPFCSVVQVVGINLVLEATLAASLAYIPIDMKCNISSFPVRGTLASKEIMLSHTIVIMIRKSLEWMVSAKILKRTKFRFSDLYMKLHCKKKK